MGKIHPKVDQPCSLPLRKAKGSPLSGSLPQNAEHVAPPCTEEEEAIDASWQTVRYLDVGQVHFRVLWGCCGFQERAEPLFGDLPSLRTVPQRIPQCLNLALFHVGGRAVVCEEILVNDDEPSPGDKAIELGRREIEVLVYQEHLFGTDG